MTQAAGGQCEEVCRNRGALTEAWTNMEVEEETHVNTRGQRLSYTVLHPSKRQAHGLLVFHHGLTEHSRRHWHVLEEFVKQLDLVVVTYDAHGHGKSEPLNSEDRAYVEDYRHFRDDLLQIVDEVAIPTAAKHGAPPGRVYLAGHSIGGKCTF
ncbi:Alpha/Beta hydrolase protein [Dunaliella salina]|uniref:Alpha/Beta hydrolase protein n=1 Tax=Dunaliella salina TaxID=3046 RepID=A0ABQ7G622_DUNSA|nr:Alpha/Beta hydrolase protein [Dunaliella salina]|eukprot:KAF5830058.1 Alpha/Beta hydrolase protein [Dunaliella salina]